VPNSNAGDHPLTDILGHRLPVFSPKADALVIEISRLADAKTMDDLGNKLVSLWPIPRGEDLAALEAALAGLRDRLRADAVERGWEVEP
jgi:hypothetical protein